jgi:hypothetical protein
VTRTGSSPAGRAHDWTWTRDGELEFGGCLTFVRDISEEHLISEFGMDPSAAVMMPEDEAVTAYVPDIKSPPRPWIRVGEAGSWTFAIEYVSIMGFVDEVGLRASLGTEAAVFAWTPKPNHDVFYLRDSVTVTQFESGIWWERFGSDPDVFLPAMRQLGFQTEQPQLPRSRAEILADPDPIIASLELLTLALGIQVSGELARGPLLTVRQGF